VDRQQILTSYIAMHRQGLAHSVEAWEGERLAGGLYGVALGGAFFGESMFHRATDASKVAARGAGRTHEGARVHAAGHPVGHPRTWSSSARSRFRKASISSFCKRR
jgi:hypothetical protein